MRLKCKLMLLKPCLLLNLFYILSVLPKCCSDKANNEISQTAYNNVKNDVNLASGYSYDPDFTAPKFGPVTSVCVDKNNNLHVMYRWDRIWDASTFDLQNRYNDIRPIKNNVIYNLDLETGEILSSWGKNLFFLPHGLTVDIENNAYITDVATHQVFKFALNESLDKPILTLGDAFKPGIKNRFCKPTSVAVLPNGNFFVADGYCNARIIQYSKDGVYMRQWGESSISGEAIHPSPEGKFFIPHALTLVQEPDKVPLLCVADRENGRVQCFNTNTLDFVTQYHSPIIGDRLFSVSYAKGQFFVVNGPELQGHEVSGYVIDMSTGNVTSKFNINGSSLSNPHDLSVTSDATQIFVAELDPERLIKFVKNGSNSKKKKNVSQENNGSLSGLTIQSNATLVLATSIAFSFCLVASGIVLLNIKRQRRRGSSVKQSKSHHGWESRFPKRGQQFKLLNLLNRKEGFEKLDQDASDDETTSKLKDRSPRNNEELA
uniref:peptidylamidoglycolate lyase n=1 Tax=Culicoides sonorensis TaxID=179676 RepID=A0A336K1Y5_CULSO